MRFIQIFDFSAFLFFFILFAGAASAANTDELIARLHTYDPDVHVEKLEGLTGVKDARLVSALSAIVTDYKEEWHLRIEAIRVLADMGDPSATDALIYASRDFCPSIGWNAANALGRFTDDPRVIDALVELLGSENIIVKEAAIQSLGKIGSPKPVPLLLGELDSRSFAIKSSVIRSLGEIGDRQAVPYLKRIAETSDEPLLKSEAMSAVEKITARWNAVDSDF